MISGKTVALLACIACLMASCASSPQLYGTRNSQGKWRHELPPPAEMREDVASTSPKTIPPAQGSLPAAIVDDGAGGGAPADRGEFVVVPENQVASAGRVYRVRPGETLAVLARRFYGDTEAWKAIYNANRDVIANPNALEAGIDIRLP